MNLTEERKEIEDKFSVITQMKEKKYDLGKIKFFQTGRHY